MYTAVVLDNESREKLQARFKIPDNWTVKCHHMTTNMGRAVNGPAAMHAGQTVDLTVTHLGSDGLVMAVRVECEVPSTNLTKHITLAVNEAMGGKPRMSNDLTDWAEVETLVLRGTVMEVN